LMSIGSWWPGTITNIEDNKVTLVLKQGVRHIHKDRIHALLKKQDHGKRRTLLKEATIASQNAALLGENARSVQEGTPTAKEAPLQAEDTRLAPEPMIPRMQSQSSVDDSNAENMMIPKTWSKIGARKASDIGCGAVPTAMGHDLTTIVMRNVPNNFTRDQLLAFVDDSGFRGLYDFLYLPVDLKKEVGLGYAYINFVSREDAEAFAEHFRGFKDWKAQSEKVCQITWSDALQGLNAHVERYRDCIVMHESIPDEFKPVVFKAGVRVPFPEPTKKIRMPRPRWFFRAISCFFGAD